MSADFGSESRSSCPPLNHHVHVGLGEGAIGQPAMAEGAEERGFGFGASPVACPIFCTSWIVNVAQLLMYLDSCRMGREELGSA